MQRLYWSSTRKFRDLKALVASAKVGTIPVNGFARQLVHIAAIRPGVFSVSEFKRTCGSLVRIREHYTAGLENRPQMLVCDDTMANIIFKSLDGVLQLFLKDRKEKMKVFCCLLIVLHFLKSEDLSPTMDERLEWRVELKSVEAATDAGVTLQYLRQSRLQPPALDNDGVDFEFLPAIKTLLVADN